MTTIMHSADITNTGVDPPLVVSSK